MRWSRATAAAVVAAVILGGNWVAAATKSATERVRQPLGNNPHPVTWTSTKPQPAAPSPAPRANAPANHSDHDRSDRDHHQDGHDGPHAHIYRYVYIPYYGYDGYYYPYAYSPAWWYSMGAGFGPEGTLQFMGLANVEQQERDGDVDRAPRPPAPADPPPARVAANPAANAGASELAQKYIAYGDALFAKQKYVEANERYRKAARTSPQFAAAWFRQGFALAAIGRCDMAAAAVKRGLKLDPAWPKSDFDLDQLLAANKPAKSALLEALANAVLAKPADADRLFVLGVWLHFDGQADRATTVFERAEQIAGNNVGHIEAFLR